MHNNIVVNITEPVQSPQVLASIATREVLFRTGQTNIQSDHLEQSIILKESAASDPLDVELPMDISILDNGIAKGDYKLSNKIPIKMSDSEKTAYGNN